MASKPKRDLEGLELRPKGEALKRSDELLRRLLATPPEPHKAPQKPAKRGK